MHIVHKPDICKLLCEYRGRQVKIEVNQTKRGIVGGDTLRLPLCEKAQQEFGLYCEADIVPISSMETKEPQQTEILQPRQTPCRSRKVGGCTLCRTLIRTNERNLAVASGKYTTY